MVLETKRLLLREMKPDDFQALFLVLGDPETMWHYPFTFDGQHVRDWIERNIIQEGRLRTVGCMPEGNRGADRRLRADSAEYPGRNAAGDRLSYPP